MELQVSVHIERDFSTSFYFGKVVLIDEWKDGGCLEDSQPIISNVTQLC